MASKFNKYIKGILCLLALLSVNSDSKAVALDKKASSALSHYIMAVMHEDLGELDKAIEEYQKALKVESENSVIHLNLAVSYLKKDNYSEAAKELKLVIKLDPEAVEPHAILALLYSAQNQKDLSTEEYELALKNASKLQPNNIDIYRTLGVVYLQQKKFDSAEKIYRTIIEISPKDAEAHFYLGSACNELGKKELAVEELKKAVEFKPAYPEALNYLGYLYVEDNKNLGQAELMIKKALEMDSNNGAYIDSLGWLYFKKGKFKEALNELEKANALLKDPVIRDHLGDVYLKTGQPEKAKAIWQESLKLKSDQSNVKEKLENLDKQCNTQTPKLKN